MTRHLLAYIVVVGVFVGLGGMGDVQAQHPIQLEMEEVPLEVALTTVRVQAGVELIYADRLVEGQTTSCTYSGSGRRDALECVLQGTGLRAERVRRHQYVLVEGTTNNNPPRETRRSLSGRVLDAETGERLPGAHVTLPGLKAGTTTNPDGYFVVSSLPPGHYDVRISYLGYKTVDTTLAAGGAAARIALAPAAVESDGILVKADSVPSRESSQMPGMVSVGPERLDQLPSLTESDLFQALQWTPGIRKSGLVSGGLSVRGAKSDQNLYLLDGAPVYHPWHAFSLVSTFQTGTLQYSNFYRGSFPVEYGGRLASVLDAQMKAGSRREPSAVAGLGVLSGRFRIEAPLTSNTSFMLSARRSYIDKLIGRTHPVTDGNGRRDTLRTGYYFYDTSAKVAHRFDDAHHLTVSYYNGRDDLDLRLPFDLSLDFESWLRPADLFFEVAQNWQNRVVSARHQYLARDNLFLTTTAYYSGYRAEEASFVQPTTTASLASEYAVRLHDVGFKTEIDYNYSVSHEVSGGLELSTLQFESTLDSELQRSADNSRQQTEESSLGAVQLTGYLQDVWSPTPRWTVQPGLRASYFSGGGHARVAPRLGARYAVHPQFLVVRASAGIHVQYLHRLRDRHSLAYDLVSSRWVPSSEQVRPATGIQVGAGVGTRPHSALNLEVDAYVRRTRDHLVPTDVFQEKEGVEGPGINVGALLGQYTRGEERALGAEFTAILDRGPWEGRFGLAWGRTFVRAPGRLQTGSRWRPSDLDVPVTLQSSFGWDGPVWTATLAAKWRTGYPISAPVARYQVGDPVEKPASYLYRPEINNDRLTPYLRMDLTLGYSFRLLSADWTATLNLYNVTNRDNELSRSYEPTGNGVNIRSQQGLPILPLFELEMRL